MSGSILGGITGLDAIGGIAKTVGGVIDDLHTSEEEQRAADLEERKLGHALDLGQQAINLEEAKHGSLYVAGWRPALGWVCAQALWFYYVPRAALMSLAWGYGAFKTIFAWDGAGAMPDLPPFPDMGIADILGLVVTLLGSATLRHREAMAGQARSEPLTPFKLPTLRRKPAEVEAP